MPKGIFRFYEELNDFLPKHRRKTTFEAEFKVKRSIKDMIEALCLALVHISVRVSNPARGEII